MNEIIEQIAQRYAQEMTEALEQRIEAIRGEAYMAGLLAKPMPEDIKTRLEVITEQIAERCGLSVEDLRGQSKRRTLTRARHEAFAIAGAEGMSLNQIGRFFGNRHHTTVMHGIERHKEIQNEEASQ